MTKYDFDIIMLKKGEKKYPFYNGVQPITKKVNVKRIIKTRGIFMGYTNYNTDIAKSQEYKVIQKASIKKQENKDVISWLYSIGEKDRAQRLEDCATWLGVSTINGIKPFFVPTPGTHITKFLL